MNLTTAASHVALERGQILVLDDAKGLSLTPATAHLWVTEEGEVSDVVVSPGDRFVVSRQGRTLAQALDDTRVELD